MPIQKQDKIVFVGLTGPYPIKWSIFIESMLYYYRLSFKTGRLPDINSLWLLLLVV